MDVDVVHAVPLGRPLNAVLIAAVEFVDDLPLTATGKIRRTELRQRESQRAPQGA